MSNKNTTLTDCVKVIGKATTAVAGELADSYKPLYESMNVFYEILGVGMTSLSKSMVSSGTSTAVAPTARPTYMARYPAFRPMTSTTEQRSWDCMVSRSLSMHSMAVLAAVSKPIQ